VDSGGVAGSSSGGIGATGGSGGAGGASGGAQGGSGGAVCASPQSLDIVPDADSYIASNQPSTQHGTEDFVELTPNSNRRTLLRFALPNALSSESVIESATLELTVSENQDFAETIVAHRMNRLWEESLVTWDTAAEGVSWSVGGGDFEVLGSAATNVELTTAVGAKVSFDLTDDVRGFLAGGANQGWLVKVNDQTGQNSDRVRFASRESTRAADRPKLVLSYCP
jgi:hypothetical protein